MLDDLTWIYPETKVTMEMADLLTIDEYIETRKLTVGGYVEGTEIYDECKRMTTNRLVWWKVSNRRKNMKNNVTEISVNSESGETSEEDSNV